ncbi:MAG: site-specific integrase [Desulfovibrio sp.]|nr:site-specific integrase [Desulfovibrio sp.]
MGDIPLSEIDRNKIREFRDILRKLPPNRHKKEYGNKTAQELIALNLKETLNIKTINVTMQAISGMFEWGIEEGYLETNPARNLSIKDNRQVIELREAFTEQEVRKIFFSGDYLSSAFKNPAYYWVPLIGLYTGMRLEEICQLHTRDIYQEDELWIIDINLDSNDGINDKILKSKNAIRKIPIHNDLVEFGFIKYCNDMKQNSNRLFPLLNKTDKSPKYGKQVGKQFSNWIKNKGIFGKKSFHSLRHTFSDYFKKRNLQSDIFTQVFGHEQVRLSIKQYGSKFSVLQCYNEVISKLHWS